MAIQWRRGLFRATTAAWVFMCTLAIAAEDSLSTVLYFTAGTWLLYGAAAWVADGFGSTHTTSWRSIVLAVLVPLALGFAFARYEAWQQGEEMEEWSRQEAVRTKAAEAQNLREQREQEERDEKARQEADERAKRNQEAFLRLQAETAVRSKSETAKAAPEEKLPTPTNRRAPSQQPWATAKNWERVNQGMSEQQVIAVLGKPTSSEGLRGTGMRTLFYRGDVAGSGFVSGNVKLDEDRVLMVERPVFEPGKTDSERTELFFRSHLPAP